MYTMNFPAELVYMRIIACCTQRLLPLSTAANCAYIHSRVQDGDRPVQTAGAQGCSCNRLQWNQGCQEGGQSLQPLVYPFMQVYKCLCNSTNNQYSDKYQNCNNVCVCVRRCVCDFQAFLIFDLQIAAIKVVVANMACRVVDRAIQVYGGMGVCQDTPLPAMYAGARSLRIADGPDIVHTETVAKLELQQQLAAKL